MELFKQVFLAGLRMIIAPLIFFSLLSGILKLGSAGRLGHLGTNTILYYLSTTSIAILIGLVVVFLIHPWTATPPPDNLSNLGMDFNPVTGTTGGTLLTGLFLDALVNPFQALAEMNIFGIVVNTILIGLAMLFLGERVEPFRDILDTLASVFFKITSWVIWLVPIGVIGIVYQLSAGDGVGGLLTQLILFSAVVIGATLFHGLVVLPAIGVFVGKRSYMELFRHIAKPFIVAFTTSSSAATLPVTLQATRDLKVNESTATFVVPFGATANMDGSALFEAIAAVFVAYLFGVELTPVLIFVLFFAAMVASIGAPGIPSGSMAGMQMVLLMAGLPLEAIAILLTVERPLDMIRTSVNVTGDIVGTTVVDRFEAPLAQNETESNASSDVGEDNATSKTV